MAELEWGLVGNGDGNGNSDTNAKYLRYTDPLSHEPMPFDVLHYDATLDLTAAPQKSMSGVCTITLLWKPTEFPLFTFHLRDLTIDSAFYEGTRVSPETVGTPQEAPYRHLIAPPSTPSAGDTATITIYYSGTMTDEFGSGRWGGVSSSNGVLYAMGVGFQNNYVSTTQHWLPCYDHPSDKATFTGRFLVKPGMTVASNGLLVEKSEEADGNILYVWNHTHPAATYLLTFAVAQYAELNVGTEELPMLLYALPNDTVSTKKTFALLPRMVKAYAERFVPYPFEKVGYVNTPQGAMEHQTMVSYPTSLARRADSLDLVVPHELAHQWFGDLVSPIDFRHAWLNESFATFCESLWLEELYDFDGYLAAQEAKLNSYLQQVAPREGALPLFDFSREAPSSNYPVTIYDKGAVVVGMLRFELGESRFFTAMQTYLQRFAYGTTETDSLLAVCEEIGGTEYDWFFDQWVRRAGWPIFQVNVSNTTEANQLQIHIEQVQPTEYGEYWNVPLEFSFITPSGIIHRLFRVDSMEQTFTVTIPSVLDVLVNQGELIRTLAQFDMQVTLSADAENRSEDIHFRIAPNSDLGLGEIVIERVGTPSSKPTTLHVYDPSGRLALSRTIDNFPFILDTSTFFSGQYIVHLSQGENRQTFSVLIQH
ncbi:MAG: M1 family aminopeptidase [Candidatus Kapaibacterium sp.]